MVKKHKGTIEIHSEGTDRGTEVIVRLPLMLSRSNTKAGKKPSAAAGTSNELRGLSVLVIENSDDERELAEVMLRNLGARVCSARDGVEALQMIESADPDLVLCDLTMPPMDGFAFMIELRRKSGTAHLPVIAVSAHTAPDDHARTRAAGFAAHVDKPVTQESLLSALASVQPAAQVMGYCGARQCGQVIVTFKKKASQPMHYAVTGTTEDHVLLDDPTKKLTARMKQAEFAQQWNQADRWMLLAVPQK